MKINIYWGWEDNTLMAVNPSEHCNNKAELLVEYSDMKQHNSWTINQYDEQKGNKTSQIGKHFRTLWFKHLEMEMSAKNVKNTSNWRHCRSYIYKWKHRNIIETANTFFINFFVMIVKINICEMPCLLNHQLKKILHDMCNKIRFRKQTFKYLLIFIQKWTIKSDESHNRMSGADGKL